VKINEPVDFKIACKNAVTDKYFINILAWENENNSKSKTFISNILDKKVRYKGANIFIEPEGGFENTEISFAKSLGFQTITLGNNILRVETAAVVASALTLNSLRISK
jgi:16S rRNA (uracil1498-N3)-methyltransferase